MSGRSSVLLVCGTTTSGCSSRRVQTLFLPKTKTSSSVFYSRFWDSVITGEIFYLYKVWRRHSTRLLYKLRQYTFRCFGKDRGRGTNIKVLTPSIQNKNLREKIMTKFYMKQILYIISRYKILSGIPLEETLYCIGKKKLVVRVGEKPIL